MFRLVGIECQCSHPLSAVDVPFLWEEAGGYYYDRAPVAGHLDNAKGVFVRRQAVRLEGKKSRQNTSLAES